VTELVGSVCIGLADLITDGVTCVRLLNGDVAVPNEGYKVAYVTILSFGVVTTMMSLAYRFRNARLVRANMLEFDQTLEAVSVSAARQQAQQNEWELGKTHRDRVISTLALLSVGAQGRCGTVACELRAFPWHASCARGLWGTLGVAWRGCCRAADVCRELLPRLLEWCG
jgi:hypothetical protein